MAASDTAEPSTEAPKKKGVLLPLILGVVLALVGGGGGFFAVSSGLLGLGGSNPADGEDAAHAGNDHGASHGDDHGGMPAGATDTAFVPLETLTISLGQEGRHRHLIFTAQLEVDPDYLEEVTMLSPRVLDVLNSYLRVVDVQELAEPVSLARLRAQMLHRVQIAAGDGRVRDLLITQFVVN